MKILLSGSGSGGHIYPCIAIYRKLQAQDHCTVMGFRPIDKKIYELNQIPLIYIDHELSTLKKYCKIASHIKKEQYDCCLTFGGKNSTIIAMICHQYKIKLYCFEQNTTLGKANWINYLWAEKIFTSLPLWRPLKKELCVGNPAAELNNIRPVALFKEQKPIILFTMGSQGASTVNKIIEEYLLKEQEYQYILVTGTNVKTHLKERKNLKIYPYYNPLTELMAESDIIVSRAGATSMAEIINLQKPSIFIPSPFVANNHQEKNVDYLLKEEACLCLYEKDLTYYRLKQAIEKLVKNPDLYKKMKENLKKIEKKEITSKISSVIHHG